MLENKVVLTSNEKCDNNNSFQNIAADSLTLKYGCNITWLRQIKLLLIIPETCSLSEYK